jgi:hypothetical protein
MADTPAIDKIVFNDGDDGPATVVIKQPFRYHHPARPATVLWSTDGSWPQLHAPGTTSAPIAQGGTLAVEVPRTAALNVRFLVDGLLPSLTMTMIVTVPAADFLG